MAHREAWLSTLLLDHYGQPHLAPVRQRGWVWETTILLEVGMEQ
jgi:hypothetical protein